MKPHAPPPRVPRRTAGGSGSRNKGNGFEREIVRLLQDAGIAAERVPLSGAAGGSFNGDVSIPVQGIDRRFEAKRRQANFKRIYAWLAAHYGLVIRDDRAPPLVVMRLADFAELAKARGGTSADSSKEQANERGPISMGPTGR